MKKKFTLLIGTILSLVLTSVSAQDKTDAPSYREGNCWQFLVKERDAITQRSDALDGNYELCYQKGNFSVYRLDGVERVEVIQHVDDLLRMTHNTKAADPFLQFPLYKGRKIKITPSRTSPRTRSTEYGNGEILVTETEKITTPAGTFNAFKIERKVWFPNLRQPVTWAYFYSPETRSIVKYFYDTAGGSGTGPGTGLKREIELIRFPSR